MISNFGAGYDHIDVAAATERNLPVGNTPGVIADATADLAFGLMLAGRRNIVPGHKRVKECVSFDANWFGSEVSGCSLGIVGMGAIGAQIALRARGFKMNTLYWSRTRKSASVEADLCLKWCPSLDELLQDADIVVLAVTCTQETHGLISEPQLKAMKRSGMLINVSRGLVVDTNALYKALEQDEIGMAALDVTDPEPLPKGHPLLGLSEDKIIFTPHLGTAAKETRLKMLRMAIANMNAGLSGNTLPYPVNQDGLQT